MHSALGDLRSERSKSGASAVERRDRRKGVRQVVEDDDEVGLEEGRERGADRI